MTTQAPPAFRPLRPHPARRRSAKRVLAWTRRAAEALQRSSGTLSVLALSPSGRVLSVDAWLWKRTRDDGASMLDVRSEFAGWPIKLIQWFFVLMYLSAVISKLWISGLDWANGLYPAVLSRPRRRSLRKRLTRLAVPVPPVNSARPDRRSAVSRHVRPRRYLSEAALDLCAGRNCPARDDLSYNEAPFFQWIALYTVFIPWAEAVRLIRNRLQASPRSASAPS